MHTMFNNADGFRLLLGRPNARCCGMIRSPENKTCPHEQNANPKTAKTDQHPQLSLACPLNHRSKATRHQQQGKQCWVHLQQQSQDTFTPLFHPTK